MQCLFLNSILEDNSHKQMLQWTNFYIFNQAEIKNTEHTSVINIRLKALHFNTYCGFSWSAINSGVLLLLLLMKEND